MNKWILIAIVLSMSVEFGWSDEPKNIDDVRSILLMCRGRQSPTPDADLADYAEANGLSDTAVSDMLITLVEDGIHCGADNVQRQLAGAAIWALGRFGGEREAKYLQSITMATEDAGLRRAAILVGMRLSPGQWEKWVYEVATTEQDDLIRFLVYEEAVKIAKNGDDSAKKNVERVFSELAEIDGYLAERLRRWAAELKSAEKSAD